MSAMPSKIINNNRSRGRIGDQSYPANGDTHGMNMEFIEYSYAGGSVAGSRRLGSISLPLPQSITDSFGINVTGKELGTTGSLLAQGLSGDNMSSDLQNALQQAKTGGTDGADALNNLLKGEASSINMSSSAGYLNYLIKSGLTSFSDTYGDSMSAASGTAVNPHQTLVFDGVNLKGFSFQWSMAPKNMAENNNIHNIIRTLKSKILPKYELGGSAGTLSRGIFKYPNMVVISFYGFHQGSIFQFKRCMANSLNVDYSPNGNAMINAGNSSESVPAFINMSMSFTEAEIWTAEDFTTGSSFGDSSGGSPT